MALTYIALGKQQQTDGWRNKWKLNITEIHEVQFLYHIFTWVWGHLLEHGRLISCHSSVNSSPCPRNYQFANSLSVKVGTWRTIPSVAGSSRLWLTWYVLMTVHRIDLHPPAMSTETLFNRIIKMRSLLPRKSRKSLTRQPVFKISARTQLNVKLAFHLFLQNNVLLSLNLHDLKFCPIVTNHLLILLFP